VLDVSEAPDPASESAPDVRFVLLTCALAILGIAAAWWLLSWLNVQQVWGPPEFHTDVNVYNDYAGRIVHGEVPYRDFRVEYPPLALPVFLLPALLSPANLPIGPYRVAFETLLLACGFLIIGCVVMAAWWLGASRRRLILVAAATAISPLLVGPLILARFDLFPALLTAAAIAAIAAERFRLGAILLALAIMAKVYPIVILPLLVIHVWRHAGRREAVICAVLSVATCGLVLLPFFVESPSGVTWAISRVFERPLQVESLTASVLFALRSLGVAQLQLVYSFSSMNVIGGLTSQLATAENVVLGVLLIAIWARYARSAATPNGLIIASAAAVAAFVAFGKVLSPQYLIWLIPLVVVLPGRAGIVAVAVLAVALALTSAYYPGLYQAFLYGTDGRAAWIVLARNVALLSLVAVLMAPARTFGLRVIAATRPDGP
jgi:uncharacterized membrane protein